MDLIITDFGAAPNSPNDTTPAVLPPWPAAAGRTAAGSFSPRGATCSIATAAASGFCTPPTMTAASSGSACR